MKKYLFTLISIFAIILFSLNGCEKDEEINDPKVSVNITVNPEFAGYKAFVALFTGNDDNLTFHAAGYTTLESMSANWIDLLEVNEKLLGTKTAYVTPGDYYIGVYIDMNNSTTNLTDLSTWLPDPGDYEMEVQSVTITEDIAVNYYEFDKVPEEGKLTVRVYDVPVLQGNPMHYNIVKKGEDSQIISSGTITFPLVDNEFVAMELDQSTEKVFEGGEYKFQIYCDLDNSQSDYTIGDAFHANYGDILSECFFSIDKDTIIYSDYDFYYSRIGIFGANIEFCGLDTYSGATSYFVLYKKDGGSTETFYGTANSYNSVNDGCYTYSFRSYEPNSYYGYFDQGSDYFIKGIVDIDSSSINEPNWENIIANSGDLELLDYSVNLVSDTTFTLSIGSFNLVQ
ncbi:MAG: hypothetical protein GQ564_00805 [Bacteroidales bacterium]|nr:hypothetical protein [Bacteroidales bacterium]